MLVCISWYIKLARPDGGKRSVVKSALQHYRITIIGPKNARAHSHKRAHIHTKRIM
jgi:hypothetical protein